MDYNKNNKRKVGAKSLLDQRSTLPLPKKKKKKKRFLDLFNNCRFWGGVGGGWGGLARPPRPALSLEYQHPLMLDTLLLLMFS